MGATVFGVHMSAIPVARSSLLVNLAGRMVGSWDFVEYWSVRVMDIIRFFVQP